MALTIVEIGTAFKVARDMGRVAAWTPEGGIRLIPAAVKKPRNWRKNPSATIGYVYFILSESTGLMKIGFSRDPHKRFTDLCTGSPEVLTLFGYVPGTHGAEACMHRRFKHLRVKGEWFRATDELFNHLDDLAENAE